MATRKTTKAHRSATRNLSKGRGEEDALALLKADHDEVKQMLEEYEDLADETEKGELARKICKALSVHTEIEETIFYPAARKATGDEQLLNEAEVEHAGAKELISQIEAMRPGEKLYDAKVTVLGEQVKHHIREEENELFPEIRDSDLDRAEIGRKLAQRKAQLMGSSASGAAVAASPGAPATR